MIEWEGGYAPTVVDDPDSALLGLESPQGTRFQLGRWQVKGIVELALQRVPKKAIAAHVTTHGPLLPTDGHLL